MQEDFSLTEEETVLLSREAEDRSRIYMFLSTLYMQRPRAELVKKLKMDEFVGTLKDVFSDMGFQENQMTLNNSVESSMREGLRLLELFVSSIKGIPESEVEEALAVEFTKLLRGIKKGYGPPPPYESVWRGEGRVMGNWTQLVLKKYHEAGIGMDMQDELPDYIGIELKFMALLSYHEAEGWRSGDILKAIRFIKLQKGFMDEHIQQWVPEFCNRMAEDAVSSFYRGCALLTKRYLEIDMERLRETLNIFD